MFDDPVGGNPDDWIYVTGTPFDPINVGQVSVIPDSALHYDLPEFEDPDDLTLNDVLCMLAEREAQTDQLAQEIERLIKQQTDWNEREYGALIYYNLDGDLTITGRLTRGTTVAEGQAAGVGYASVSFSVPSDLGPGGIVAAVHNHPDIGYNNSADLLNHYPSYNGPNDNSDYLTFESLVGVDDRFATAFGFSLYILGPDGTLREFDLKDGRLDPSNDPDPNSRNNLYQEEDCQSDGAPG